MKEIFIATKNKGKVKEFQDFFAPYNVSVTSLLDHPDLADVEETGKTFEENAILKAEQIAVRVNQTVLADDSGLVIDALDGRPGVYSARYAGEERNDQANMERVLMELKGVGDENRTARFICVLAIATPNGDTTCFTGNCEGKISTVQKGDHGFGYDPIFIPEGYELTMAQLSSQEKNKISHRKHAMDQLQKQIHSYL